MSDSEEYIDAYFKQQLNTDEKRQFEERCLQDDAFARKVALFITVEEGIRQKLLNQKKQQWAETKHNKEDGIITPFKKVKFKNWLPYLAAACLLFAVAVYYIFNSEAPQKFANQYVSEHFTLLSQTMNASRDSMQQGIAAYNNKDYNKALKLFEKIYQSHRENSNAKKNIGLVYLVTKDYDKALQQFDELAERKDLYINQGLFLKAITLLQRNGQGDKAQAKALLERVARENAAGSKEAKKWLEKW